MKLILYVPISRFTDIYIYEYYHLLFQYCIGIFWHQEVVLRRNQKEICDYSKLFEYRKYTEEEKKNLIVNFIPYGVTAIVFLSYPLLTRKVVESAIILIPIFCSSFRSLFFLSIYNSYKNGIPCNEIDFKSLEAMENPVTVSSLVLPVLAVTLLSAPNWNIFVIVFLGTVIVFIQDLWHLGNMRINRIKSYKKIILLFLAIGFLYFLYWLTQKMTGSVNQSNLPGLIIPVISAVFIFNFSAICYLVQENYHKYNSVLLIKESLNFTTILVAILIPAGFVLLLIFSDVKSNYLLFWSIVATTYSLGSSIWLLFRIRFLLNDRKIILRLMARLSKDDIKDYCQNLNTNSENPIDTMQKVLTLIIKNDDVNLAEDCFVLLFKWIALNLDCIHETSDNYWRIQQNRFNKFLIGLSQEVSKADNYVMRQNFSYSIYEGVLLKSEIKLIKQYEIIYLTLESFIKNELEKGDRNSEKVAENAFHIMVSMVPKYLHYMECCDSPIDGFSHLSESDEWHRFNEIVIKSIKECIYFAIEKKKIEFLKSTYLITRMFREYEEPFSMSSDDNKFLWNDNVYRCLQEVTNIYYRIYTSLFDERILSHIEMEYRQFVHLVSELNYSKPVQRAIFNSFFNSYCTFIAKMLENKKLFTDEEFYETVCEPVFEKCSCQYYFNAYMNLFFTTTKQTLDLYSENAEFIKADDLMRIVGRIMQMKEYLQEECEFKFEKNVLEKFDEYEKSYTMIYKKYAEYEKKQELIYMNFKKAMRHI